jgi:hypothetical protein
MQDAQAVALAPEAETIADKLLEATTDDIARLAYHLWEERGCPIGSPEDDWFRAEELLTAGLGR